MAHVFTTEITSDHLPSDNPLHQRLLKAYVAVENDIKGDVLEVGCGEGRGIDRLMKNAASYTAIDKIEGIIESLRAKYPGASFISGNIPPLHGLPDNSYDTVVSFQVIEHIADDRAFLKEIHRVLKPGGKAFITTPNREMTLTRNPWHIREYTADELTQLARSVFATAKMKGIGGDEQVMQYYFQNKRAVDRIVRFDLLNLQHRLPASWLKVPYEILNRWNRNKLKAADNTLVANISHKNYLVVEDATKALDLFLQVTKG